MSSVTSLPLGQTSLSLSSLPFSLCGSAYFCTLRYAVIPSECGLALLDLFGATQFVMQRLARMGVSESFCRAGLVFSGPIYSSALSRGSEIPTIFIFRLSILFPHTSTAVRHNTTSTHYIPSTFSAIYEQRESA